MVSKNFFLNRSLFHVLNAKYEILNWFFYLDEISRASVRREVAKTGCIYLVQH